MTFEASNGAGNADAARHVFLVGLRNAHALENQALALMDRQIEQLAEYAEVEQRLQTHRGETEIQIDRLEQILDQLGETHSTVKDVALKIVGNLAALGHVFAPDEIIKNSFANFAFENYEAATYKALIVMAREAGLAETVPLLEASLEEELAMVAFLDEMLPSIIRKYIALRAAGEHASS
jgi:ferritin-like metal-binding protein YciE